jgi:hypothetical protein
MAEASAAPPNQGRLRDLPPSHLAKALRHTAVADRAQLTEDLQQSFDVLLDRRIDSHRTDHDYIPGITPVGNYDGREERRWEKQMAAGLGASFGAPGEAALRMALTRKAIEQRGYLDASSRGPAGSVRQLVDAVIHEPAEIREELLLSAGPFNRLAWYDDLQRRVFPALKSQPQRYWQTLAALCTRGHDCPRQQLERVCAILESHPPADRDEVLGLLAPFSSLSDLDAIAESLATLPREQWREHTEAFFEQSFGRDAEPHFGLTTLAAEAQRQRPQRRRAHAPVGTGPHLETQMNGSEIAWTKAAISELWKTTPAPTISFVEMVKQVVAEIERIREAGEPRYLLAERGGQSELDNALRTLEGNRVDGDYTCSVRRNQDFITVDGQQVKIGALLARAWSAAASYAPAGLSAEETEKERQLFRYAIIDGLAKCIEIDDKTVPPNKPKPPHRVCSIGFSRNVSQSLANRIDGVKPRVWMQPIELQRMAFDQLAKEHETYPLTFRRLAEWSAETVEAAQKMYGATSSDLQQFASGVELGASAYEEKVVEGPSLPRKEWLKANVDWREANPGFTQVFPDWLNLP